MKTVEIKIFNFEELSPKAKERVIADYSDKEIDTYHIYEDAYASLKQFNKIFSLKEDTRSFLNLNTDKIEDNILQLEGLRLQKYLYNNFYNEIFQKKIIGSFKTNQKTNHPRIKSEKLRHNNFFNQYYSKIHRENCCVLTGGYYDNEILGPIYDFLKLKTFDKTNFKELLKKCYDNLKETIEKEVYYLTSEESIKENILDNDYYFLITGEKFLNI